MGSKTETQRHRTYRATDERPKERWGTNKKIKEMYKSSFIIKIYVIIIIKFFFWMHKQWLNRLSVVKWRIASATALKVASFSPLAPVTRHILCMLCVHLSHCRNKYNTQFKALDIVIKMLDRCARILYTKTNNSFTTT